MKTSGNGHTLGYNDGGINRPDFVGMSALEA